MKPGKSYDSHSDPYDVLICVIEGKIEIKIPAGVPEGTDHDYGFVTAAGKCTDPRAHVM